MGLSAFYGDVESDEERFKVLDAAYDAGERNWDSADMYVFPLKYPNYFSMVKKVPPTNPTGCAGMLIPRSLSGNGSSVPESDTTSSLPPNLAIPSMRRETGASDLIRIM